MLALIFVATGCMESEIETRSIKGLQLESNATTKSSGAFILGVGVYNSDENIKTYYYTYIMGKEGYRLQELDSCRVEIVETNDIQPSIKGVFSFSGRINEFENYVVYVPVGTIFEEYSARI